MLFILTLLMIPTVWTMPFLINCEISENESTEAVRKWLSRGIPLNIVNKLYFTSQNIWKLLK